MLGEQQRVPAGTAAEIERGAGAARLQLRQQSEIRRQKVMVACPFARSLTVGAFRNGVTSA
jgi:hypothetical protein